jgi:hypothetical protein
MREPVADHVGATSSIEVIQGPSEVDIITTNSIHQKNKSVPVTVKGTLSRDFRLLVFFHQSTPPRALTHGPNRFAYGFVFAEIIASKVAKISFSGVNDTAETENEVLNSPTFFA